MRGLLEHLDQHESCERAATNIKSRLSGWSQKGGDHIEFHATEQIPLEYTRDLGQGAHGRVDEVRCRGELVARKTVRYTGYQLTNMRNELDILQKLDSKHIIKFIGSYTQVIPSGRVLALLLWPVATCDLAAFLEELGEFQEQAPPTYLTSLGLHMTNRAASTFLRRTYGCLANAISYLHENKIRHKDLKPQNILLSERGLYVTDFGIALDFGELSRSTTDGNERGTPKYFAPELEDWGERGRPADIYSLGCVYLEITTLLCGETLRKFWGSKPFLYRQEPERVREWTKALGAKIGEQMKIDSLLPLIETMLCTEPRARPEAAAVAEQFYRHGGSPSVLHAPCCKGLSLLEELFDTVATAKVEDRQSKVRAKSQEQRIEELTASLNAANAEKRRMRGMYSELMHANEQLARELRACQQHYTLEVRSLRVELEQEKSK